MSRVYKSVPTTTVNHAPFRPQPRTITWWSKASPALILLPAALSIAVLFVNRHTYTGKLLGWSINNRGAVQVVIQVISSILSFFWLYSIREVISQWTRYRLSGPPLDLNRLRLWSAISSATTNWNLPWAKALVAMGFFAVTLLPATLWAGALTPSLAEQSQEVSILVPGAGYNASIQQACSPTQPNNGTFTNCPSYSNNGDLLSTIASATSVSNASRHHSKWSPSNYTYIGRSYGIGSGVGLTDQKVVEMKNPAWYSFTETGFIARPKCIYNDSAAYSIKKRNPSTATSDGYPDMFMVSGLLPNSNWTGPLDYMHYAQIAFENSGRIVGIFDLAPRAPNYDNGYYFGIVAGVDYRQLNNIQCEVDFEPKHFTVHVSTQNRTINVTSISEPVNEILDPNHYLRTQAINSLPLSVIITSLYTNAVGDAFLRNVHNMHTRKSLPPGDSYTNDTILEAVADSISAMMDDALVALNSYLLMNVNTTKQVTSLVATPSVRIGTRKFVIAGVVVNVAGLIFVFLAWLYLARLQVPLFDYNDLGCMALSATRDPTCDEAVGSWDGDPKHQILGSIFAKLEVDSTGRPVVILHDHSDFVKN